MNYNVSFLKKTFTAHTILEKGQNSDSLVIKTAVVSVEN